MVSAWQFGLSSQDLLKDSLAWPDPLRTDAYRLEIISARGAYNL